LVPGVLNRGVTDAPSGGEGPPGGAGNEPNNTSPAAGTTNNCDAKLDLDAIKLLIEGEQRLLGLFDARQGSADTKLTAAATGALALPAATLALAERLTIAPNALKLGYAIVVVLVIIAIGLRLWNGAALRRRDKDLKKALPAMPVSPAPPQEDRRTQQSATGQGPIMSWNVPTQIRRFRHRKKLSTESARAEKARLQWQGCEPTADLATVQGLALELWRARALDSREMAQKKEKTTAVTGGAFVLALIATVLLVACSGPAP